MTTPIELAVQQPAAARPVEPGPVVRAAIWLPGLAVALAAAVATAHGLYEVAVAARVPELIAWLYPLITDGLALVAYAATARLHTRPARRYAWAVVVLAAGLSGLAQAAYLASGATLEATPALRFGVGAWPAVAAAIVAHLLYLLATDTAATAEATARGAAADEAPMHGGVVDGAAIGGLPCTPSTHLVDPQPAEDGWGRFLTVNPDAFPEVFNLPSNGASAAPAPSPSVRPDPVPVEQPPLPVEHPPAATEHPVQRQIERPASPVQPGREPAGPAGGSAPRERAWAAATWHADRHGALPTVSELEALAGVSRGTAATALKALRDQPTVSTTPTTRSPTPGQDLQR